MSEFDLDIRITEGPQGAVEPAGSIGTGPGSPGCLTRFTWWECSTACSWDCTEQTCASECATCWPGVRGAGPQCI